MSRSRISRIAAAVAILLVASSVGLTRAAAAGDNGKSAGTESVTSAQWGAAVAPSTMTFGIALAGTENLYSTISNTGTIGLVGLSYQVTLSGNTIVVVPLATFTLFSCSVAWTGATCSGTATTIGTYSANTTTTVSTALVLPPVGGNVYLEVHMVATAAVGPTMTVVMLVTGPTQTRASITTNQ